MGVGSQRRGARSYTCGLRSDPQALGRGAHIRVDLSQPPDESRLRIFDPDHRSVDLCDDDPTDAQKASEGHRVRASQTSSSVLLTEKPVYGPLRAWLLTVPPLEGISYFAAGLLFSVPVKSYSLKRSVGHK